MINKSSMSLSAKDFGCFMFVLPWQPAQKPTILLWEYSTHILVFLSIYISTISVHYNTQSPERSLLIRRIFAHLLRRSKTSLQMPRNAWGKFPQHTSLTKHDSGVKRSASRIVDKRELSCSRFVSCSLKKVSEAKRWVVSLAPDLSDSGRVSLEAATLK